MDFILQNNSMVLAIWGLFSQSGDEMASLGN